jgi:4-alpha-glucanotransferase
LQLNPEEEDNIHWRFIAAVMTSGALLAIVPLQDVLGLGSEARMNVPGRARGNWRWRVQKDAFEPAMIERLRELTRLSGR